MMYFTSPSFCEMKSACIGRSLSRYLPELRGVAGDARERCRIDGKVELCRDTYRTEHAECVFFKTCVRFPDRNDDAALQVLCAAVLIDERARIDIICKCVDGKISPLKVVFEFIAKLHLVGSSCVGIFALNTVRCHLYHLQARIVGVGDDTDRAEVVLVERLFEEFLNIVRPRVCRYVPILGLAADEEVTHAATDEVCFVTGFFEHLVHAAHDIRNRKRCIHMHIVVYLLTPNCSLRDSRSPLAHRCSRRDSPATLGSPPPPPGWGPPPPPARPAPPAPAGRIPAAARRGLGTASLLDLLVSHRYGVRIPHAL